jgi:hypothetical protein
LVYGVAAANHQQSGPNMANGPQAVLKFDFWGNGWLPAAPASCYKENEPNENCNHRMSRRHMGVPAVDA